MKNIYKNSTQNLNKAKKILIKNNVISLPTETVYGLGEMLIRINQLKEYIN